MGECYNVVVLGAGVQGSATAYYLKQKVGIKNVLLLERFTALHTKGSSHGKSRITRHAYPAHFYVKMMEEAFEMWRCLEEESHTQLYIKTGIMVFGSHKGENINSMIENLGEYGIPHTTFSGSEANQRYEKQLKLPDDFRCALEDDGGILLATKAVKAYQERFVAAGGELRDEHAVTEIVPGQVITVRTDKGSFRTKKLVVTVGAWSPRLLRTLGVELPFEVIRTEVQYWKVDYPEDFSYDNFPTFIYTENGGKKGFFYGLPIYEYPGLLKVCAHTGPEVNPDHRDADMAFTTAKVTSEFIGKFFKGVAKTPSIVEPCMYTFSPDENPVLDRHPDHPNIIIGAGFSGHGFKLSPVIGKILSELCLGLRPSYDLSPFKMDRFKQDKQRNNHRRHKL